MQTDRKINAGLFPLWSWPILLVLSIAMGLIFASEGDAWWAMANGLAAGLCIDPTGDYIRSKRHD